MTETVLTEYLKSVVCPPQPSQQFEVSLNAALSSPHSSIVPGLAQLRWTLIGCWRFVETSPPCSQSGAKLHPPALVCRFRERERPPLSLQLKSRRNGQKRQVTVSFRSHGWTLCVLHKLVTDMRILAGRQRERGRERKGRGRKEGRKNGRKEVKAVQPNQLPGRRLESLRFSRTISGEETHNCSSLSTYLSAGWYGAIPQEEKKKKKKIAVVIYSSDCENNSTAQCSTWSTQLNVNLVLINYFLKTIV